MLSKKHTAFDELFRRLRIFFDDENEAHEQDINDFIDNQLNCVKLCSVSMLKELNRDSLSFKYDKSFQKIVKYLTTLKISRAMNRKKF